MSNRSRIILVAFLAIMLAIIYAAGLGLFSAAPHAGSPTGRAISPSVVTERSKAIREAATEVGVAKPKQILFGDLHVHTTFSFDAFQLSLPMSGGEGAHPVADACDYARHCSGLDFWSMNDHAITLTPRRWAETVETVRQCNALAGDSSEPDNVAFLGWEWTQVGPTPETHWGHKNVILRDLEDDAIPTRPISAGLPPGAPTMEEAAPSTWLMGLYALSSPSDGAPQLIEYLQETASVPFCPSDVPVRELPADCREVAPNPESLFSKLDDWGHEALVIPHGTAWGFYTPPGSSWDKQLTNTQHNPKWQKIIEFYSGHGNSEEYKPYRAVTLNADGTRSCPEPTKTHLPSCWRAGEIIEERCLAEEIAPEECSTRAAQARQYFVDADRNGGATVVPGATVADWQDAGQCQDCFQPAFNMRPRSTAQYILALNRPENKEGRDRFRFGTIAASDNHSARPGTGYKEVARTEFTESRFGNFLDTPLGEVPERDPEARAEEMATDYSTAVFSIFETERGASFFLTGGLAGVHSEGRSREEIWDALQRNEIYGTSGPRILLWFDLLNPSDGGTKPMGSEVELDTAPIFQVRAVGSFEQKPGCPEDSISALSSERLEYLCQGECYNPSDTRRKIARIEVVRIRPQLNENESVTPLIEDPWRVLPCPESHDGCQVAFTDPDFSSSGRDAVYYVRAIESGTPAIDADPLGCEYDAEGRCVDIHPCFGRPDDDNCLAETEQRAWSSPIFVDQKRRG